MPIAVKCDCGRTTSAADEFAGRKGKCPGCGAIVAIPVPELVEAPAPAKKQYKILSQKGRHLPLQQERQEGLRTQEVKGVGDGGRSEAEGSRDQLFRG